MTNWIDLTNYSFAVAGLIISVLGLLVSIRSHMKDPLIRRFFIVMFSILVAYTASTLLDQCSLYLMGPEYSLLSRIALFMESSLSSLLMPLLSMFILYSCGDSLKTQPVTYISNGLWLLYMAFLVLTQFTRTFFYIDDLNVYHRGPLYFIILIPPALLMLTNLIALIRRRNKMTATQLTAFLVYLVVPLVCMLIQMWSYGLLLIVIGTTVSALIMLLYILRDQQEQFLEQEMEHARQEISIRMLQIRPHFIYNTLSSIYYLCELDPKKAQQVIKDFTVYLRKNYSAIVKEELIPFEEELEHTKAYLAVEKARYEKYLFVEYDIPFTAFRLPPLTLQPIAENAVKHGLDTDLEPLHILIRTLQQDNMVQVIIEDTGPGFDLQSPEEIPDHDGSLRIGLSNVRERLKLMADASLDISAKKGGGTAVTISIPLGRSHHSFQ